MAQHRRGLQGQRQGALEKCCSSTFRREVQPTLDGHSEALEMDACTNARFFSMFGWTCS